jgi:hypothetical protein
MGWANADKAATKKVGLGLGQTQPSNLQFGRSKRTGDGLYWGHRLTETSRQKTIQCVDLEFGAAARLRRIKRRQTMMHPIVTSEMVKYRQRDIAAEIERDRLVRLVTANDTSSSERTGAVLVLGSLVLSTFVIAQMFIS